MKKVLILIFVISFYQFTNAQSTQDDLEDCEEFKFAVLDEVPVFPGCGTLEKNSQRRCFQTKIMKHVSRKFNASVADSLGLPLGKIRIYVNFTIDSIGDIKRVTAKAPHQDLEDEGIRVVKLLPKMTPGKMKNKAVNVSYVLPITYAIQ